MNGFVSRFNEYLSHNVKLINENNNTIYINEEKVMKFISNKIIKNDITESFFVLNIVDVIEKHRIWVKKLPRVRPYYSVKANNNQMLLDCLAQLGIGFDCVSEAELRQVLSLGAHPQNDIIYANPIEAIKHLHFARQMSVHVMTFDNSDELAKIKQYYPDAKLVIRLRVGDSESIQPFMDKYGCLVSDVRPLLSLAKSLDLDVIGVSFHVGCRCSNAQAFSQAISQAKSVYELAQSEFGYKIYLLNIGGGFPGTDWHSGKVDYFSQIAMAINTALEQHFPAHLYPNLSIIGEPGTYYCASAFYLAVQVIGKRIDITESTKHIHYYINDGMFGSFFGPLWGYPCNDKALPLKLLVSDEQLNERSVHSSTIWGQTLASLDVVVKDIAIPELNTNEWLVFKDVGDYSVCLTTRFCGFEPAHVYAYGMNNIAEH